VFLWNGDVVDSDGYGLLDLGCSLKERRENRGMGEDTGLALSLFISCRGNIYLFVVAYFIGGCRCGKEGRMDGEGGCGLDGVGTMDAVVRKRWVWVWCG
jgi:hypothetical protein